MASLKILVAYSNCKHVVALADASLETSKSSIRAKFSDYIKGSDQIALDVKDEEWGGVFFDFHSPTIKDGSIFRIRQVRGHIKKSIHELYRK